MTPGFGLHHLPYGIFRRRDSAPRVGVRLHDDVLDLVEVFDDSVFAQPSLNAFMAQGPDVWQQTRAALRSILSDPSTKVQAALFPVSDVDLLLPFAVADYVDYYSSLHHAENVGRMFRPDGEALQQNWRHLPVGYHGRAGTVVVSGTPIVRPQGQRQSSAVPPAIFGPSQQLDFEAEIGFVVGVSSPVGNPISVDDISEHVFGVVLVNDWSARDIQAWEYVPLGPNLGKSFATSVSAWVTPLAALEGAKIPPPVQQPEPLPYLRGTRDWGLDLHLAVAINGGVVSRPPFAQMYWTPAQQLAQLTSNGANVRTGDLYASGTVSGAEAAEWGSCLELSWNATSPFTLSDGTTRTFLDDGDTVTITASAPGISGMAIRLGDVTGTVVSSIRGTASD